MNTNKSGKTRKPRKCSIPDDVLIELGEKLKREYMSWSQIIGFIKEKCNKNWGIESILCVLDQRGYKVAEGDLNVTYGKQTFYKVFTARDYEKIEEEHRKNAKGRLLAAVSY
jgi:hypothetical protein